MKRLLIGDTREKLLSTLEVILKHWGYRVLASSRPADLLAFLQESSPDLIILGASLVGEDPRLGQALTLKMGERGFPLLLLCREEDPPVAAPAHERLAVPLDLFALFASIQKHLEKIPRSNLRLEIRLPGMLCRGSVCHIADVLSLSTHGLFIKTGFRAEKGDSLTVVFPLLGRRKELELEGRVLYRVSPDPENNYLEGVGVEFARMDEVSRQELEAFLEDRFLGEVCASQRGAKVIEKDQLQNAEGALTLRLLPS